MYLKRIEIKGFKSFADPIHFPLSPGVTAFVGPNGCGKSNIVDSIRWTFGGRARSIRGSKMEDVLFTGNNTKPKANSAEVALVFNNKDGQLDYPEDEVSIKRVLTSDSTSKYLINNVVSKAGEMKKLFEGQGIGSNSYAIIEQGKIGQILMANSDERRVIFEEAAGITATLARIKETKASLETTLQQLELVSVETDRLKKEKRKLEEQAKKARKWSDYKKELREKQILLGRAKWHLFKEKQEEAKSKIKDYEEKKQQLEDEFESLNLQIQEAETKVNEVREEYNQKDRASIELGFELEQQNKTIQMNMARIDELNEEISQKLEQNILLKQQVQAEEFELNELEKDSGTFLNELELSKNSVEEQSIQVEECNQKFRSITSELEERRQERFDSERTVSELRNQKTALVANAQNIRANLQRIGSSLTQKQQEKEELHIELGGIEATLEEILAQKKQELAEFEALKKQQEELNQAKIKQKEFEQQNMESLFRVRSRLEVLQKLEEAHEGYQDGVIALQKEGLSGFRGLLLEHVSLKDSLDEGLTKTLDVFLQERVQFALFQDEETTLKALDFLKEEKQGRTDLVNQEQAKTFNINLDLPKTEGVLGCVADYLNYSNPELAKLFEDILLVENRKIALTLLPKWSGEIVTINGEIFRNSGVYTGGKSSFEGIGLISRKTEIENLAKEVHGFSEKQEQCKQTLEQSESELSQHLKKLEEQQQKYQQAELESRDTQKDYDVLQLSIDRLAQECQNLTTEQSNLNISLEGLEEQEEDIEDDIDELEETIHSSENRVQQLEFDLKKIQTEREQILEDFNQAQIQFAQAKEKQNNRETILKHRKVSLEEKTQRLVQNENDTKNLEEKIITAGEVIEQARTNISTFHQKKENSQEGLVEIKTKLKESETSLEAFVEQKQEYLIKVQELDDIYHQAALQEQEQEIKLEELHQRFIEEEIDLSELEKSEFMAEIAQESTSSDQDEDEENKAAADEENVQESVPEGDEKSETGEVETDEEVVVVNELSLVDFKALEKEIQSLKRKINKIGSVNLDSLNDLEETDERLTKQLNQQNDCVSAKEDIEKMLHELEENSRDRFRETFETVRKSFREIFEVLFNGGYADIELEPGKDELTAGIQILAKPPGKSPRNLNLLSGGEKTMTTIALLFAVFRSKPSPFCILDEVDAALDEENIERFIRMLITQFVQDSQFIIITHRKPTMRIANTIYGITMQTAGISTRIAVDLENVEDLIVEAESTKP